MKVIAYSNWQRIETFTVRSTRDAKRLARQIRDEQKLPEILTEKEYRNKND